MTTLNLVHGGLRRASKNTAGDVDRQATAPSVVSALTALLQDAQAGGLTATTSGDRWLLVRIEEALRDVDEIRQMATYDRPAAPIHAGVAVERVSIRARRALATA